MRWVAEFIVTLLLVVFGCGVAVATGCAGNEGIVATALAFCLVIVAMAYSIGNISGCHINPAVSVAMLINKKMSAKECLWYIVSQVLGAIVGALIVALLFVSFAHLGGISVPAGVQAAFGEGPAPLIRFVASFVRTCAFLPAVLSVA